MFVHFFNADSQLGEIEGFTSGVSHDVDVPMNNTNCKYALDLDGRDNRYTNGVTLLNSNKDKPVVNQKGKAFWSSDKQKLMQEFCDRYYDSDYGKYVNNYDHMELIEKK